MNKKLLSILFLSCLFFFKHNLALAQCPSLCELKGVGLYVWLGDGDSQNIGDATNDDEDGDDFIGFKNYSSVPVDISGWQLFTDEYQERTGSWNAAFTFPSGTILQPGQYALVVAEWNGSNPLPLLWFNAGFNTGGEGLFEETSALVAWAILSDPSTHEYITVHQQGGASTGQSLPVTTFPLSVKLCNSNLTSLIPTDFDGCETVYFNDATCTFSEVTDCSLPLLNSPCGQISNHAPQLNHTNVSYAAPATGYDLNSLPVGSPPLGSTLVWYTNAYHTGSPYTSLSNAPDGPYYAFYYYSANTCYSASAQVAVTQALGVGLLNFSSQRVDDAVLLNWETSSENNNKGFIIERAADSRSWSKIGFVNSLANSGNNTEVLKYAFKDNLPLRSNNYYRLIQVDFDGQQAVSNITNVLFNISGGISIYPNPAKDVLFVNNLTGNETVIVSNNLGAIVKEQKAYANFVEINMSDLPTGTYHVSVVSENNKMMHTGHILKRD